MYPVQARKGLVDPPQASIRIVLAATRYKLEDEQKINGRREKVR